MHRSELEYELPPERIAQAPSPRRDASRLLVVRRSNGALQHETFARLPSLLPPGALLVLNDTRVVPARLELRRKTGGHVDGLFLREVEAGIWEVMLTGSARLKPGEVLAFAGSTRSLRLVERRDAGTWRAGPDPPGEAKVVLDEVGRTPLPPYIRRETSVRESEQRGRGGEGGRGRQATGDAEPPAGSLVPDDDVDRRRYQTIYARQPGAVAAPTAGLHFTEEVFDALRSAGFSWVSVTLHVGVGTFAPIRCDDLAGHRMHAEWYDLPPASADAINAAKAAGRPVVAVGTTSVRVLETCADRASPNRPWQKGTGSEPSTLDSGVIGVSRGACPLLPRTPENDAPAGEPGRVTAATGWTDVFIYPPYRFRVVDALLTNFHLPGSTLLALVFAFADQHLTLTAYRDAIRQNYRFYSYGDAMLVV